MARPDTMEHRVVALADDIRRLLDRVLERACERRWDQACREGAALVEASRQLQNEVDYRSMSEWLERAKTA